MLNLIITLAVIGAKVGCVICIVAIILVVAVVGISLSGLFAIWASTQTDKFIGIASISGSLWYDEFVQRFSSLTVNPAVQKFFISFGDKEKKSKDQRMSTVEEATNQIVGILKEKGFCVDFTMDEGTHFSSVIPRLQAAFNSLYCQ